MSSNRGHQPIMPATAGGKAEAERTGAEIDEGSRRFGLPFGRLDLWPRLRPSTR